MGQRLKNIVRFTGITPNVATSLPHGLITSEGHALVPDLVAVPPGFTVTADSINVTVTGNDDAVDVYVESWHTVERAFADVAVEALTPQPYVLAGGASGQAATGTAQLLYFAPSHPQGPGGNRYTTWAALYDAIEALRNASNQTLVGQIIIDFDFSFVGGEFQIPAGTWNMSAVRWQNDIRGPFGTPRITFADGCSITSSTALIIDGYGGLTLVNDSLTNTPFILKDFFGIAIVGKRTELINRVSGAAPLFKADPTAAFCFIFTSGANAAGSIGGGAVNPSPVVDCAGRFFFLGLPHGGLEDDTLADSVGTGVYAMPTRGLPSAGRNGSGTWRQSKVPATTAFIWEQMAHLRRSLTLRGVRPLGTSFVTRVPVRQTPYMMGANEVALVDTAFIGTPISGSMTFDTTTDTISGADFSKIRKGATFTIAGTVSNNGVKTAAANGTTTSIQTVENLTNEGPVAATATVGTAEVILPPATPMSRGTMAVVKAITSSAGTPLNILPMTTTFAANNSLPTLSYNLASPTDEGTITAISVDGLTITVNLDAGAPALNAFAGQILVFPDGSFGDANAQQTARRTIASNTAADPSAIVITTGALTAAQQAALIGARVQIRVIGTSDKLDGGAGPFVISQAAINKASGVEFVSDGGQVDDIGTWWSY